MKSIYQISLMCLLGASAMAQVPSRTPCPDLSGKYILENNDLHDITYYTSIVQNACADLVITQSDGLKQFTIQGDWITDGKLIIVDEYSTLQASWSKGVANRIYKFSDPLHSEASAESISYQLLPSGELKRTLDLINPDSTHDHFETFYKKQTTN